MLALYEEKMVMSISVENEMGGYGTINQAQQTKSVSKTEDASTVINDQETDVQETNQETNQGVASGSELTVEQKDKVLKQLKEQFKNTQLEISYNEDVNRFSVTVLDKDTKKVIKEIPSEDTLKILEHTRELAGLLVDEKR